MLASLRQRFQDRRRARMLRRQRSEPTNIMGDPDATIYFDTSQGLEAIPISIQNLSSAGDRRENVPYPVVTTNYVCKESRRMSLLEPDTLLAMTSENEPLSPTIEEEEGPNSMSTLNSTSKPPSSKRFSQRKRRSSFFSRRPSFTKELSSPRVAVFEKGYPGQLTPHELAECQKFDRAMKESKLLSEIVMYFESVEEPPYAICRHLRSCKFDAQKQIDKLLAAEAIWKEGQKQQFCPDLETVLHGVPPQLVFSLFPVVYHGNAKNGCPIRWIKVGGISPDGLLSMITLKEGVDAFSWNQNAHVFPKSIQKARAVNPDFVRCEAINVIDMTGLSRAQMSSDAIDVLKQTVQVNQFFPETLHWTILLNAPGWFSFTWNLIKGMNFLNPRTVAKVEVYSNKARGEERLFTMVEKNQVPIDFGGTAPQLSDLIASNSGGDGGKYNISELRIKKGKTSKEPELIKLAADEQVVISIHSRSVAPSKVSIFKDNQTIHENVAIMPPTLDDDSADFLPYSYRFDEPIQGPGIISIEMTEHVELFSKSSSFDSNGNLTASANRSNNVPRGYYCIATCLSKK